MNRIDFLSASFEKTRGYTNAILDRIPESDWVKQPEGGVTHVSWQVAHLAVAQYALGLKLIRGIIESDEDLMPESFYEKFGRTSIPDPDPANNPSAGELRQRLDEVHQAVIANLKQTPDSVLDEPSPAEHPMFTDKFGSLVWCTQHEFNHAGQLSLIRRLLGNEFTW